MNKRIKFIIPVVVVAVAGWFALRAGGVEDTAMSASGTVEATTADLGFQVPGRVLRIAVEEGDAVQLGQELARLDTREMDAGIDAAQAQLNAAEARLREMQAGARPQEVANAEAALRSATQRAETAERDLERARTLFSGGAISRQALDQAEAAASVAASLHDQARETLALVREGARLETLQAQRAMVAQARANVARSEAGLANAVVHAPFAGRVTLKHREPGETVGLGAPVVTLLDPTDRWVRIYVREDQMGAVQIGMPASISSDTWPDRTYPGEVVFIGSEAEFTPRNVQTAEERTKLVYPVKVRITGDPDFELKPGIPADVILGTAASTGSAGSVGSAGP